MGIHQIFSRGFNVIIFITAQPTHSTKNQIINTFMNAKVPYIVLDPSIPWFKLRKNFQNDVSICLLAPDHPNAFKICSYLLAKNIYVLNPPRTTLLCKQRIEVNIRLNSILTQFKKDNPVCPIHIPMSRYYKKKGLLLTQVNEIDFPFVIKYPINHLGIHHVELIQNMQDLSTKIPKFFNKNGIYTEQYVEAQELLIKTYHLGDTTITQQESHHLTLEAGNKLKEILFESKNQRKTIDTPLILKKFTEFIAKEMPITFFGLDLLRSYDDQYWVIDFNDFPGSRGIFNAGEIIANCIIDKIKGN
ncbi:MAG: hypothetical protein JW776_16490 [Candidatus Lokiarchaeota archaeon]|nr:hypothetical protein [Candidatus Lokiarchaeota archaeon]